MLRELYKEVRLSVAYPQGNVFQEHCADEGFARDRRRHGLHLVDVANHISVEHKDKEPGQIWHLWSYDVGFLVSSTGTCTKQPTHHVQIRSGAFAVVRSALVPNLTVSQDPTCEQPTPRLIQSRA